MGKGNCCMSKGGFHNIYFKRFMAHTIGIPPQHFGDTISGKTKPGSHSGIDLPDLNCLFDDRTFPP